MKRRGEVFKKVKTRKLDVIASRGKKAGRAEGACV
jgi:hypothetical protein